jgi:hypothetical protein
MWNATLMQSQALLSQGWPWNMTDTAVDVGAWFALCATLGFALSWLRELDAPATARRLDGTARTQRAHQLARA